MTLLIQFTQNYLPNNCKERINSKQIKISNDLKISKNKVKKNKTAQFVVYEAETGNMKVF